MNAKYRHLTVRQRYFKCVHGVQLSSITAIPTKIHYFCTVFTHFWVNQVVCLGHVSLLPTSIIRPQKLWHKACIFHWRN